MTGISSPSLQYDYERDPAAIYRQSFEIVRRETELSHLPETMKPVAIRLVHACGMTDIVSDLVFSNDAAKIGRDALVNGACVFTDVEMVVHGIIRSRLPMANDVICTLNRPEVSELASTMRTTRSAAAVSLWNNRLEGSIVVIGNAPTALFQLLQSIAEGGPKPALVIGFPVGFVGAAESKEALAKNPFGLPYIALKGRRGGSAMAAAVVNALASGLIEEQ